jgi:hypothetical protein
VDNSSKLIALVLLFTCACTREPYQAEPPRDVRWTAVVQADAEGRLVSTTPLLAYDGRALSFPKHEDAETIWILGFDAATIAALGTVREEPLSVAYECDAALPEPAWSAVVFQENETLPALPKLSAPWLRESCPLWQAVEIDVACAPLRCRAYVTQEGCTAKIDLAGCNYPEFSARIQPDGTLCIPESEKRCQVDEGGGPSLMCTTPASCAVGIFPNPGEPEWKVESVYVVPNSEARLPGSFLGRGLDTIHRYVGWFADFTVNGDKLFVATHNGEYQTERECVLDRPMYGAVLSLDSLQALGGAVLPACTSRIVADPSGAGFLGIYFQEGWKVGRFDETASLVATSTLPLPYPERHWSVIALIHVEVTGEIWGLMSSLGAVPEDSYVLFAIDPRTLGARAALVVDGNTGTDLATSPEGLLAVPESYLDAIRFYDAVGGTSAGFGLTNAALSIRLGHLTWIEGARNFLLAVPGEEPALYSIGEPSLGDRGRGFLASRDSRPLTTSTWPKGQDYALIGTLSDDTLYQAQFAVYDARRNRFEPPVLVRGYGAPTQMKHYGNSVYVGLAWEGRILRITP